MRIDCEVIEDLLPLYVEEIASDKSKELIDEHVTECESCRKMLMQMQEPKPQIVHSVEPMKKMKKRLTRHTTFIIVTSIVIAIAIVSYIHGTFFLEGDDAMGFALVYYYGMIPMCGFVGSLIAALEKRRVNLLLPVLFGLVGCLLPIVSFGSVEVIFFWLDAIISLLGLGIGMLVRGIKSICQKSK